MRSLIPFIKQGQGTKPSIKLPLLQNNGKEFCQISENLQEKYNFDPKKYNHINNSILTVYYPVQQGYRNMMWLFPFKATESILKQILKQC